MAQIDLCFVWHMHQPFYKDLVTGEYKLPWTRLHGLKDYYGMVEILAAFPSIHQTFNLVPSMVAQLDEYAAGAAEDPFLRLALKPAEELTDADQAFLLRYFFQANLSRMVYRYPRYGELYELSLKAGRFFGAQEFRDLQILSQLAWFDEIFLAADPEIRDLVAKGRHYSLADQKLMGRKQLEILGHVVPVYQKFAATGQIEVSTTPYYHPILPLLCDSDIAAVAHPHVPLPTPFRYPEDARHQLLTARDYMQKRLNLTPQGLWPSEGSVSDQALLLAADCGFRWFATDNGVLARTLGRAAGAAETYRPYLWQHQGRQLHCLFRDHYLSDLVGFVYSKMGPEEAADHFLGRIRENCNGRDSLVPIILDGENAWEYFPESGREFLRQLYTRIAADPGMQAVTVSEGLARHPAHTLDRIFPGSWINANFDIWIGADEDNRAWEYLRLARAAFDQHKDKVTPEQRALAYEEILIAEGSDWCWWYGPEHESANRTEFDQLFRDHLANVYRALELPPPDELSRPILRLEFLEHHHLPTGHIDPTLDGQVSSYFEWMGAGEYHIDQRQGAMHGGRIGLQQLLYGTNGQRIFLRFDFDPLPDCTHLEIRIKAGAAETTLHPGQFIAGRIIEAAVPLTELQLAPGDLARFQVSLWQSGLPLESLPRQGVFELATLTQKDWN
ncbi:MAG: glycoside hydrolase [Acidobacteriota bacterium]